MELSLTDLRADCARCVGVCCVAPGFAASADFAIDKPAATPCPHLRKDFRCGIHATLRERGFPGCAVFDCFGAGQQLSQHTFAGQDWRQDPVLARRMFAVFGVLRQVHELLWHLHAARRLAAHTPGLAALHADLNAALDETTELAGADAETLLRLDLAAHHAAMNVLLRQTSERVRAGVPGRGADSDGADLIGARLTGTSLRGVSLRGAQLIGADLRGVDLALADVTGADLRGANLRGANLADTLFLTQAQLDAASGDATTTLPAANERPAHW